MKVSGMIILSRPDWGCYPYMESIKSCLPVVDEMVVVLDKIHGVSQGDETRNKLHSLGKKIRIIDGIFDLDTLGWLSYGIMRTSGYLAAKGDVVMMFDADGVLHENDIEKTQNVLKRLVDSKYIGYYWEKKRFYTPTRYWPQHKHSGIYNKAVLGDRMSFYDVYKRKGIPNPRLEGSERVRSSEAMLFGYEHLWDTWEVIREKVHLYHRMIVGQGKEAVKTEEEAYQDYRKELMNRLNETGVHCAIEQHPKVIQQKLREINENHFGFNFFEGR